MSLAIPDYAAAARALGLTRARLTQVMKLLLLSTEIQERIAVGELALSERDLRRVSTEPDWSRQIDLIRVRTSRERRPERARPRLPLPPRFGNTKALPAGYPLPLKNDSPFATARSSVPSASKRPVSSSRCASDSSDVVSFAYNPQGEQLKKDQPGNAIVTAYDVLGREIDRNVRAEC